MNRRERKQFLKDLRIKHVRVSVALPPSGQPWRKEWDIGRNDKCPCGSEVKYKNCCLNKGTYENYREKQDEVKA
jgi:uncharacterized protein YecA (UPF0149 family)